MKLERFLLDEWLDRYGPSVRYDLAASTGPSWNLDDLRSFMTEEEKVRLFGSPLSYCPGHGAESLRHEIASMYGAGDDEVLVVAGASEALLVLFFLAAETPPGSANVVVPHPAFPPVQNVPASLGLEVRLYPVDADVERIESLVDERTRVVFVNSPHNPTGSVMPEAAIGELDSVHLRERRGPRRGRGLSPYLPRRPPPLGGGVHPSHRSRRYVESVLTERSSGGMDSRA
jgi:selenocysteine lyase/cysteine desulfurase